MIFFERSAAFFSKLAQTSECFLRDRAGEALQLLRCSCAKNNLVLSLLAAQGIRQEDVAQIMFAVLLSHVGVLEEARGGNGETATGTVSA